MINAQGIEIDEGSMLTGIICNCNEKKTLSVIQVTIGEGGMHGIKRLLPERS